MRSSRLWVGLALVGAASAACSAILDLEAPPTPDAAPPIDAMAPDLGGDASTDASTDASPGVPPDGEGTPLVCASLDAGVPGADAAAAYRPFGATAAGGTLWELFNTTAVSKRSQSFAGGTFDGRYVYFAPATNGLVTRLDTTAGGGAASGFQLAASWSTYDVATLPGGGSAGGFSGASFDGRYVYFVPHGLGGVPSGVVVRFDSTGDFGDPASWGTFDTSTLVADGGAAAKGFSGASSDGRYLYFVPNSNGGPDGRVVRYDTAHPGVAPSPDAGRIDGGDGGDAGASDAGTAIVVPGTFEDPALWATFDVSGTISGAAGFMGAAFDGRSLYLVPFDNGGLGNGGYSGIASRFKTDAGFATASSWSPIDLTTINGEAVGFSGAAFDGRYVYFVPHQRGIVLRFDTTFSQPTAPAAWSTFDVAPLTPIDGGGVPQFGGAAFDGRFVYIVPSTPGFGVVARYDTLSTFTSGCAWSTVDLTQLDPAASFYLGAVFDGQYVYFIPRANGLVARFEAKAPPSLPNLPAFHGSFY